MNEELIEQTKNLSKLQSDCVEKLEVELDKYRRWVDDLQSGMYINCVYCGHRYGPKDEVPSSMADVLKEHIEKCPKHPMSILKTKNKRLKAEIEYLQQFVPPPQHKGGA